MSVLTVLELEVIKNTLTAMDQYDHELVAKLYIMQRELIAEMVVA